MCQINIFYYVRSHRQHDSPNTQTSIFGNRFSGNNFKICDFNLKLTRFAIGFTNLITWDIFLRKIKVLKGLDDKAVCLLPKSLSCEHMTKLINR